jgi:hypothetical protein
MLEKLCARARHTYATFCSNAGGGPQTTPITLPDDIHDLSAFGGTKGGVIKSPASSPPKDTPSPDSSLSAVSGGDCPLKQAQSLPAECNLQQPQYLMPYTTAPAQDATPTPTQTSPDFGPSMFVQTPHEQQSMLPCFERGYSVHLEGTQFSSPLQESAHQENPMVLLSREGLEYDLEALGVPPVSQQSMQYNLYPQLDQFRDIFMGENTDVQPPQVPQQEVWYRFIDDLGIQGI